MAVIDPTYLWRERNHFPKLTDAEFEMLSLYCQALNYREIADFRGLTERQVRRVIRENRLKFHVSYDRDMLLPFLMNVLDENFFPEKLTDEQSTLLCLYTFTDSESALLSMTNYSRKELRFQLTSIINALGIESIYSAQLLFLIKVIVFRKFSD